MEVVASTSYDVRFPPSSIVDGDPKTFWSSTGLFPQSFVLRLAGKASLAKLRLRSANIKHVVIERCDGASPLSWAPYVEQDLPDVDGVQEITIATPPFPVTFLKVTISQAYVDYCFVYTIDTESK